MQQDERAECKREQMEDEKQKSDYDDNERRDWLVTDETKKKNDRETD
jgi:hypothetical protein